MEWNSFYLRANLFEIQAISKKWWRRKSNTFISIVVYQTIYIYVCVCVCVYIDSHTLSYPFTKQLLYFHMEVAQIIKIFIFAWSNVHIPFYHWWKIRMFKHWLWPKIDLLVIPITLQNNQLQKIKKKSIEELI